MQQIGKTYGIWQIARNQHPERYKRGGNAECYAFQLADYPLETVPAYGFVILFKEKGILNGKIVGDGYFRIQAIGFTNFKNTKSFYIKRKHGVNTTMLTSEISDLRRGIIPDEDLVRPPDKGKWTYSPV